MADFFISYTHDDAGFVNKQLIPKLKEAGFTAWINSEQLRAGRDWRQAIDNAIRSSFALIVVMSPKAKKSEYVTYEWAYALGVGIDIIPILLGKVKLHPRLEALQYLNFTEPWNASWDELITQLNILTKSKSISATNSPNNHKETIQELLEGIKGFMLALGSDVQLKELKLYTAFERAENFASVIVQAHSIKIFVKLNPNDIKLEPGFTRDVRKIGHWGIGDVEIVLKSGLDLEKAKPLIIKSYEAN